LQYGNQILEVDVPENNLLAEVTLTKVPGVKDEKYEIKRAIYNPIAHEGLAELAKKGKKAIILVDDFTRLTPAYKILPILIKELNNAGLSNENIEIMIAGGTHRPMSPKEIAEKVGEDIISKFKISSHNIETVKDKDQLVDLGKTPSGVPVSVNRKVVEADIKIAVGQIVGHPLAGWGGGGKIIQPGVCGEETTWRTHWLQTEYKENELLGVTDNPIRLEIEEVAKRVGLDFIVNVILNEKGQIVGVVAGDPIKAFRKGVDLAKKVYAVKVPEKADIVLTDAYPHDIDMWQAVKGIFAAEVVVKDGGTIILCAPCPEGVSGEHPALLQYGYIPKEQVEELIEHGKIDDLVGASDCAHVGELLKRVDIILYSEISRKETEKLNFKYAETPKKALEMALAKHGRNAKIIVMRRAGDMVPIIAH